MRKGKRYNLISVLVILLLGITLGYAYLNTELNINGTSNVSSVSWNIYWDNIVFGSNNVTDVTTLATIQSGEYCLMSIFLSQEILMSLQWMW